MPLAETRVFETQKRMQPFSGGKTRVLTLIDAYLGKDSISMEAELNAFKLAERR